MDGDKRTHAYRSVNNLSAGIFGQKQASMKEVSETDVGTSAVNMFWFLLADESEVMTTLI